MLTPLQERVASIVAGLAEAEGFALAGGAALIARGEIQRETRDLDFFGLTPGDVDRLVPAVDRAPAGRLRRVQVSPGFARLIVESGDDSTELDLGADARLFPAEPRRPAPTLSGEELAVDKVLAVFGRAEARDFVDLAAVEARYGLDRLRAGCGEGPRLHSRDVRRDGWAFLPTSAGGVRPRGGAVRGTRTQGPRVAGPDATQMSRANASPVKIIVDVHERQSGIADFPRTRGRC